VTKDGRTLESRFLRGVEVGDRYGVVLVAIGVTYILFSTIERARWSRLLLLAVLGITLLLVLFASRVPRAWMRVAVAACVVSFLVVLVEAVTDRGRSSPARSSSAGARARVRPRRRASAGAASRAATP